MMVAIRHPNPAFWRGRRVLVTGHTGFKGSWLALWLTDMGAEVTGLALPAEPLSLFELAQVGHTLAHHTTDLADARTVHRIVQESEPEIIFHLAAQPIVRRSMTNPVETFATNVLGTAHLLDAARRRHESQTERALKAILVITSDKVYANDGTGEAFTESTRLGGKDPYSASKAATELVVASFRDTFFAARHLPIATARGGNVIGGGDFSPDRIVPDCVRAFQAKVPLVLRYPDATRPWQHVLDCLAGYLLYAEALASQKHVPHALNFGPDPSMPISVRQVAEAVFAEFGHSQGWHHERPAHQIEAQSLAINPQRAREELGWQDRLPGQSAIHQTADWYGRWHRGENVRAITMAEIRHFIGTAPHS